MEGFIIIYIAGLVYRNIKFVISYMVKGKASFPEYYFLA